MSKTIDEKVVSMQFDNRNFEKNVATTMSTLDKLKTKLNLNGASKGLENIDAAAKKVDLSNVSNAAENLRVKFSVLDVVGVTAISRITNTMMNFASKTLSFLTNGIVQGGINRAMNIENARFQLQGLLKDETAVAAVMQNVKDSVDGTAYSLDAAASVASQLAASGMKAGDKMYRSLRGIAGVAAMTNSEYSEIGRIYTQVAGQGRLMGDQLLQLSGRGMNAAATLGEYLHKSEAEVRDMVSKGKIDFDTFAMAMDDTFGEHAKKANDTFTGSLANIKSALARIGEAFVSPLIVSNGPFVHLFNAIREKVNTFKDAVVPVAENVAGKVSNVIELMASAIKGDSVDVGGTTGWDTLAKKITDAGIPLEKFQNEFSKVAKQSGIDMDELINKSGSFGKALLKIKDPGKIAIQTLQNISKEYKKTSASQDDLQKKLQHFQEVVDKVWNGDYKNQPFRADLLEKAGYEYVEVQELVNKTVDGHRLTLKDLSEEQLKSVGYTNEEIKAIKELAKQAQETGTPINDLIQNMGKLSKGQLVFETLSNAIQPVVTILKSLKDALNGAFTLSNGNNLYAVLESLHSFSEALVMNDEVADKLTRTFKGLFAAMDLISNTVGGGLRLTFQIVLKVLEELAKALGFANYGILSMTAAVGDAVVKIRDWYKEHNLLNKVIEVTVPLIVKLLGAFSALVEKILELPQVQSAIKSASDAVDNFCTGISNWFDTASKAIDDFIASVKNLDVSKLSFDNISKMFDKIPTNSIKGLTKGFADGAKDVIASVVKLASDLVKAFCERLGIHSPSTVFIDIAKYCIQGLTVGFGSGLAPIVTFINKIIDLITDPFKKINFDDVSKRLDDLGRVVIKVKDAVAGLVSNIPWDKVSAILMSGALLWILKQLVDVLESIVSPLEGVTNVLNGFTKVLSGFASIESAYAKNLKAKSFKEIAEALGILTIAIVSMSYVDPGRLWSSIGAITALATVLGTLAFAVSKLDISGGGFAKFSVFMLSMSAAIVLISAAVKNMAKLNPEQAVIGFGGLVVVFGLMTAVMYAYGKFVDAGTSANIDKAGSMILKISASLILLSVAVKLMGTLSVDDIQNGVIVISSFIGAIALMGVINKKYGSNFNNLGSTMLKISASLIILTAAIKLIGTLSEQDMRNGVSALTAFVVFVGGLVAVTKIGSEEQIAKVSGLVLAVSVSITILAATAKILSTMDNQAFIKGIGGVALFGLLIEALIASMKGLDVSSGRIALTMLAMSVSVGILAGISVLLSLIDLKGLVKGTAAVGFLGVIVAGMVACARGVADCKGTIMMLSVAIATLAVSVAALSFIDPKRLASATGAMSLLMVSLAVMMKTASGLSKGLVGPLVTMSLIVGTLGIILYSLCELPVDKAVPIANSLSKLILSLSAACAILTAVGSFQSAAFIGIGALTTLIVAIGTLMTTVGWLANKFNGIEKSLKKGIEILNLIAHGLGEFFGNIVSGFMSGVLNILPDVGLKLSQFWINSSLFFLGMKYIGSDTIDSVKNLTKALMLLTTADFVQKISSWLTGELDMDSFSKALSKLGTGLAGFADKVKDVDANSVKNASKALLNLANASKSMPKEGGWLQTLVGNTNIDDFGNKLAPLGAGLKSFSEAVSGVDSESVKNATEALVNLANASKSMPKQGGWLQKIIGETDLSDFGTKLGLLGSGLQAFSTNTKDINAETMTGAVEALNSLVAIKPPKSGGLWQMLVGESSLGNLGDNLKALGVGLKSFYGKVKEVKMKSINSAIESITSIVQIGKDLDDVSFDAYGFSQLCITVGEGIKQFINSVKGTKTEAVTSAQKKVSKMRSIIESLIGIDTSGVEPYVKALRSLSKVSSDSIVTSMNTASANASSAVNSLFGNLVNTVNNNKPKVSNSFVSNVSSAASAMQGQAGTFSNVGTSLISNLARGISNGRSNVTAGASGIASAASNAVKGYYSSFYGSGRSLTEGFISGIKSMTSLVTTAASTVANAAANALHKTLKINSPSKVTRKDGKSFGEGFVLGIKDMVKDVSSNATEMATQAIGSLEDGLSLVRNVPLDDVSYNPTVSPIIDLQNVRAGFEQMKTMFNAQRTFALAGSINVQSQAQSLRETVDNAVNSAIGKLNENIQNGDKETNVTIEVPVNIDGREVAKATAPYTKKEIDKIQTRNDRKRGIL